MTPGRAELLTDAGLAHELRPDAGLTAVRTSPTMRCWTAGCACCSHVAAIASAMMRSCWRPRRRRSRASWWSISAPASAPPALRSRIACPALSAVLVEIDAELAALAAENARRNGLGDRVKSVALDVGAVAATFAAAGLGPGCADHVLMNPPFNDPARTQASPDSRRRLAHAASRESIALWVTTASRLLAPGGVMTVIWRADGLGDMTAALMGRLALDAVLPIRPRPSAGPIRVIVRALKGKEGRLAFLPGLDLNDEEGRPTAEAEAVMRQGAALALAASTRG